MLLLFSSSLHFLVPFSFIALLLTVSLPLVADCYCIIYLRRPLIVAAHPSSVVVVVALSPFLVVASSSSARRQNSRAELLGSTQVWA